MGTNTCSPGLTKASVTCRMAKQEKKDYLDVSYGIGSFHTHKADLNAQFVEKKTGQQLCIRWERHMQDILEKYPMSQESPYLLPALKAPILQDIGSARDAS